MPSVRIYETKAGFRIKNRGSEKFARVFFEESLLKSLLADQKSPEAQAVMEYNFNHDASHDKPTFGDRIRKTVAVFKEENAFWHIHGILASVTGFYSVLFFLAVWANRDIEQFLPLSQGLVFALVNLLIAGYSFYALASERRVHKRRSAFSLSVAYLFYVVYFLLSRFDDEFQTATAVAFLAISLVLYVEWSRPPLSKTRYNPVTKGF